MRATTALCAGVLAACGGSPAEVAEALPYCEAILAPHTPSEGLADLEALVGAARDAHFGELDDVEIELVAMESETDFFVANLDLSTASADPLDRTYRLLYNVEVFEREAPHSGVGAILVHELEHIVDYTGMDTAELAEFAIWYAQGDISAYERATDERVLELGCAEGLRAYRVWLYAQLDAEAVAQKRLDYYTPEEIDAWVAAQGG